LDDDDLEEEDLEELLDAPMTLSDPNLEYPMSSEMGAMPTFFPLPNLALMMSGG
jgi:hypothetical protein